MSEIEDARRHVRKRGAPPARPIPFMDEWGASGKTASGFAELHQLSFSVLRLFTQRLSEQRAASHREDIALLQTLCTALFNLTRLVRSAQALAKASMEQKEFNQELIEVAARLGAERRLEAQKQAEMPKGQH